MTRKKFLRRDSVRYSKLGKNRKKLKKWRRPKGRDNKMRENRKGYPRIVSIGYKSQKSRDPKPILIHNENEFKNLTKNTPIILAKLGAKKKLELIKKASELNLNVLNIKGGYRNEAR